MYEAQSPQVEVSAAMTQNFNHTQIIVRFLCRCFLLQCLV